MSSEPTYKLIYFDARGRAEHIRYIFAYAGMKYIDERIPDELWPELKDSMPYGQLPVLEIDGKQVAQSHAVGRYLAKKFNLTGKTDYDAMQCDMHIDSLEDLKQYINIYRVEEDPERKQAKKMELLEHTIPYYMNKFDELVTKNGGNIVPDVTTWADFVFVTALESYELIFGPYALNKYPGLRALQKKINSIPAIADWLARRPFTEF